MDYSMVSHWTVGWSRADHRETLMFSSPLISAFHKLTEAPVVMALRFGDDQSRFAHLTGKSDGQSDFSSVENITCKVKPIMLLCRTKTSDAIPPNGDALLFPLNMQKVRITALSSFLKNDSGSMVS
jgi:hypothetical protein